MKEQRTPLVSIVILNWNGIDDTLKCLASLQKLTYRSFETIVIDNGSTDASVETLRKQKNIKLITLPKNTGFTGGHIEGLKHAKGDYIVLLNNDLVVAPDWLTQLVDCAKRNNAAIVGGRAYQWDDTSKPGSEDSGFVSYQTVSPFTGHTTMLQTGDRETEANNLSGSNLLVRNDVIEKVGYLDNSFFAYYEETDFIARAKRAGFKAVYCPGAKVWHKSGASSRNNPYFYFYQMHRNRFRFAFKNYDPPYFRKFLRHYTKEMLASLKQDLKHNNHHDRAMVSAYFANILALPSLIAKRQRIKKIGKSYNEKLVMPTEGFDDITIIVPCYNYEEYVTEALNSIEKQTLKPSFVIIINDGSTDNSAGAIKKWLEAHQQSPVHYSFIDKKNEGVIKTKNLALDLVKTNWMMFLDADDLIDPEYVYKCIARARRDDADIVYTDMEMFGSVNSIQKTAKFNPQLLKSVNFVHNSALMKTSIFKDAGGYKEKMSIGFEDWELYLTISSLTKRFSYIEEPLLKYRRHENASRDISAQNKLPTVVKYLEELHPDLYTMRFYWWLETYRTKNALRAIASYPFKLTRHTKSHLAKHLKSHPESHLSRTVLNAHKKIKKKEI